MPSNIIFIHGMSNTHNWRVYDMNYVKIWNINSNNTLCNMEWEIEIEEEEEEKKVIKIINNNFHIIQ